MESMIMTCYRGHSIVRDYHVVWTHQCTLQCAFVSGVVWTGLQVTGISLLTSLTVLSVGDPSLPVKHLVDWAGESVYGLAQTLCFHPDTSAHSPSRISGVVSVIGSRITTYVLWIQSFFSPTYGWFWHGWSHIINQMPQLLIMPAHNFVLL